MPDGTEQPYVYVLEERRADEVESTRVLFDVDKEEAERQRRRWQDEIYTATEDVFNNITTPSQARGAANQYEELIATQIVLARYPIGEREEIDV